MFRHKDMRCFPQICFIQIQVIQMMINLSAQKRRLKTKKNQEEIIGGN